MRHILAQSLTIGEQTFEGPLPSNKFNSLGDIVNSVLQILFPIALFLLFVYLMWSGIDLIRNLGDTKMVESAKSRITNAVIGIILLGLSYWVAQIATKAIF
jgi:hypothetical protein